MRRVMEPGVEQNGGSYLRNIWRHERSACSFHSQYPVDVFLIRLRRVYILFNARHALNEFDVQMLSHLSNTLISARGTQPFTLQSVITKSDCIPLPQVSQVIEGLRKGIWEAAPLCLPPIITSAAMSPPFGIEEVRQNIAEACHPSFSPQKKLNSRRP
jgi:hypothetical protein